MIKYALQCEHGHAFEGWFSNSGDYDRQHADALLVCPVCESPSVEKALMAPAVSTGRRKAAAADAKLSEIRAAMNETAQRARDYVEKNFVHVGKQFPEEARKIHYGEADERPIYGDATPKDVKELTDEGIVVAPVPEPEPAPADKKAKLN